MPVGGGDHEFGTKLNAPGTKAPAFGLSGIECGWTGACKRVSLAELLVGSVQSIARRGRAGMMRRAGLRAAPARGTHVRGGVFVSSNLRNGHAHRESFFRSSSNPQMAEVSPEIRQALLDVFSVLDRNGSMQIDQKEIGFLMNKMLHFNLTELEISRSCPRSATRRAGRRHRL